MAKEKEKCFLFYQRWYEQLRRLPDEEKLQIYESICEYAFEHVLSNLAYYLESIMDNIRYTIDDNEAKQESYNEQRKRAIEARWKKQKEACVEESIQPNTSVFKRIQPNTSVYDNKNKNKNKEQEQEQEIDIKKSKISMSTETSSVNAEISAEAENKDFEFKKICEEIKQFFNKEVAGTPIKQIKALNATRLGYISARLKDYDKSQIFEVITKASQSDFLQGCSARGFTATFDWLMRPNNFLKTLEGNYDNKPNTTSTNENNFLQTGRNAYSGDANAERAERMQRFAAEAAERLANSHPTTDELPFALQD